MKASAPAIPYPCMDHQHFSLMERLARIKEEQRRQLREKRVKAEQELFQQACIEVERKQEAKEREMMTGEDEDAGKRCKKP